jgi:hypothetical protein
LPVALKSKPARGQRVLVAATGAHYGGTTLVYAANTRWQHECRLEGRLARLEGWSDAWVASGMWMATF